LFKHFDTDDSDYITAENLKEAFEVGGRDLDDSEVQKILKDHDLRGDNRLSFDEFKSIFFDEKEQMHLHLKEFGPEII
jgi:calcium-dependent protein kinase